MSHEDGEWKNPLILTMSYWGVFLPKAFLSSEPGSSRIHHQVVSWSVPLHEKRFEKLREEAWQMEWIYEGGDKDGATDVPSNFAEVKWWFLRLNESDKVKNLWGMARLWREILSAKIGGTSSFREDSHFRASLYVRVIFFLIFCWFFVSWCSYCLKCFFGVFPPSLPCHWGCIPKNCAGGMFISKRCHQWYRSWLRRCATE